MEETEQIEEFDGKEQTPEERYASLPAHLRRLLEPEQLKKAEDDQRAWAAQFGSASPFTGLSPQMAAVRQASREIPDWREARAQIKSELDAANERGDKGESARLQERFDHFSRLLGESLRHVGEYDLAATIHPDKGEREKYKAIQAAIDCDDDEGCGPECAEKFDADPTIVTRETVEREVFSPKHQKIMPMVKCAICGKANVRALPPELAAQHEARQRAIAVAGSRKPAEVREALKRENLTSEKVFRL